MDVLVLNSSNFHKNIGIKENPKDVKRKYIKRIERNIKAVQIVLATVITVCFTRHFLYSLPLLSNSAVFLQLLFLTEATAAVYFGIRTIWYGILYIWLDD